jgi:hypothetical protein
MDTLASWLVHRLREPTTYAGLGVLLAGFGLHDSASWANAITTTAMGLAGIAAMVMAEKGVKG